MAIKKKKAIKDLVLASFGIHLATWLVGCAPSAGGGTSSVTTQKIPAPPVMSLTSVSPTNGPIAGGTTITITGTDIQGSVGVAIGGVAATGVQVNGTATQVTCVTPAATAGGAKDIRVTSSLAGTAALIAAYTYQDAPVLTSITPASAPQNQNTAVTIVGTGFSGDVTVSVGGVAATSVVVTSATQLTCVIPASNTAAVKDVSVTSSVNGTTTRAAFFTHTAQMSVTSISPAQGILTGGDTITINGAGLLNVTSVTFGTSEATILQQTLTGVAVLVSAPPAAATGAVAITITSSTHGQLVLPAAFTYTTEYRATGIIRYQDIPVTVANALDTANPVSKPARLIDVEVVRTDRDPPIVLGIGQTDLTGTYNVTFTRPANGVPVQVRAIARIQSPTAPTQDFFVQDNTGSGTPTYTLLHPTTFNVTDSQQTLSYPALLATDASRINGPFAILDAILSGVQAIRASAPATDFPALTVLWSRNNKPVNGNIEDGDVGTSFYVNPGGNSPFLVLLGDRSLDSDEFDKGVVMHEFGHYLEDQFGRSDSLGGQHAGGDILDIRVAFGEGFGNAISSMLRNDPLYLDTFGNGGGNLGGFDLEDNENTNPQFGYFSELSISALLYDLFDTNADTCGSCGGRFDNAALGIGPIFAALGDTRTIDKVTSLHEFIRLLKNRNAGQVAAINEVVEMEGIATTSAATTSINNPAELAEADVFTGATIDAVGCAGGATGFPHQPIYRTVNADTNFIDHVVSQSCQSGVAAPAFNRLFGAAFYLVTAGAAGNLNVTSSSAGTDNVDLFLTRQGSSVAQAQAADSNEILNATVTPGTYVLEVRCLADTADVTYNINFNLP